MQPLTPHPITSIKTSLALLASLLLTSAAQATLTTNTLNFNATAIAADGRYIWFNSVLTPSGIPSTGLTHLYITSSTLAISTDGTITAPNMTITFDPSLNANTVGSASLTYSAVTGWSETLPATGLSGNDFLDGVPWLVTSPAGNANVTWRMNITTDRTGVSLNWQAAAAVYTPFTNNPSLLGVKPVDDNTASVYQNSDHAGTPENYKGDVTGGATGGGGSNFTGSYSPTVSVTPVPEPTTTAFLGIAFLSLVIAQRSRRQ
ncbi:MAG: hypothetical protein C5B50_13165 [Verrucomicrobia bacterium]|nr:MAG: hypothetical protein C5B50_13165 [Verrucomicrobiota bacterium]